MLTTSSAASNHGPQQPTGGPLRRRQGSTPAAAAASMYSNGITADGYPAASLAAGNELSASLPQPALYIR